MKKILLILMLLPGLLSAQNLQRWGSTGATSTLHGNWFYNAHPAFTLADTLKLVDFRLLRDTAAALRSAMGGGGGGMSIGGTVSSGTTGSVLFVGGSSALAQDNSNFFWDNSNKRLGIGTATPAYRFDVLRATTGQTADSRTINISTSGSTFNTTAAARINHAGYFSADASVSTGAFGLTNIGVMGMATGGDNNYGIATSNSTFTGVGYFYQSANNTTRLQGGPGTDNIQWGADNRIRLNTPSVIIPSGSLSVGSNSDDGIASLQVYGYQTLYNADSTGSPANMMWLNPSTKKIMIAAVPAGAGVTLASGTYTPTLTNESNITSSIAYQCMYYRVGNNVTVSGKINVDYTATGTATLGISLPIASDIANDYDVAGVMHAEVNAGGVIRGDATNNRAQFYINTSSSAGYDYFFTFTYIVQ